MTTYVDPFTLPILDAEIVSVDLDALPGQTRSAEVVPYTAPLFAPYVEPKRGIIRRTIDDPYWLLMGVSITLGLSIVGTIVYGIIQMVLAVVAFLNAYGADIAGGGILLVLLAVFGGGGAVCAGIHCAGCKG